MRRASHRQDDVPVSQMEIVNTLTKLIFGDESLSARESAIIAALRAVDANVLHDDLAEMGGYLRNLGVREMIQLVARVHRHLATPLESGVTVAAPRPRPGKPGAGVHSPSRRPR